MRFHHLDSLHGRRIAVAITLLCSLATSTAATAADWTFRLQFPESVHHEPYTGRVYVFFSHDEEPRHGPDWFHPGPMIARDVESLAPGESVELSLSSDGLLTYPPDLKSSAIQGLKAQAVMRFNPWEREVGDGPGNGFSAPMTLPGEATTVDLNVDHLVPPMDLKDNEWCRLFRVRSQKLSDFHHRDVFIQAAVNFPPSYHTESDRRYPVIVEIPGFGGTLPLMWKTKPHKSPVEDGVEFLHVILDGHCGNGHHEFADSANNGPWGAALIEEFLPAFDQEFRSIAEPYARMLTGHSSGGWSSLWLQITYPETFAGTWSTAPDSVDFRDFQKIDIYAPGENLYRDRAGERRPIARINGKPVLWLEDFCQMENVLGHGGQMHSFEAVFSPRGENGLPQAMWNPQTGDIDLAVAETWKRYDIRRILEENWETLGPRLKGKIHVFMGGMDTFYLDGATALLKESQEKLGSDAVIEIHPGKDHRTLMTSELRARIAREMGQAYLRGRESP
jgi:hypothetical protein